jgi:hypothetical protein
MPWWVWQWSKVLIRQGQIHQQRLGQAKNPSPSIVLLEKICHRRNTLTDDYTRTYIIWRLGVAAQLMPHLPDEHINTVTLASLLRI